MLFKEFNRLTNLTTAILLLTVCKAAVKRTFAFVINGVKCSLELWLATPCNPANFNHCKITYLYICDKLELYKIEPMF